MCGEHRRPLCRWSGTRGSSPHVRGALGRSPASSAKQGIIPACAGSTSSFRIVPSRCGDHPRMCGEHTYTVGALVGRRGSSPHVRGAPAGPVPDVRAGGIIPACAGSTPCPRARSPQTRDHPRMCGEHRGRTVVKYRCLGSSPHVRGAPCFMISPC